MDGADAGAVCCGEELGAGRGGGGGVARADGEGDWVGWGDCGGEVRVGEEVVEDGAADVAGGAHEEDLWLLGGHFVQRMC